MNDQKNVGRLKRVYVELSAHDLTSVTDQTGMEALISQLPGCCSEHQSTFDNDVTSARVVRGQTKEDTMYIAMAIQLARFQQALCHTCDGHRFFPGKADLAVSPGCRVFEDLIDIEDLSRAYELFTYRKHQHSFTHETLSSPKDGLAQKPYFYPLNLAWAHYAAKLDTRNVISSDASEWEEASGVSHDQTLSASIPDTIEPHTITGSTRSTARIGSSSRDQESGDEDKQTLSRAQARIEASKAEARQKQKEISKKVTNIKQAQRKAKTS